MIPTDAVEDRRAFMSKAAGFMVPPAMVMLFSTSLTSPAIGASGGTTPGGGGPSGPSGPKGPGTNPPGSGGTVGDGSPPSGGSGAPSGGGATAANSQGGAPGSYTSASGPGYADGRGGPSQTPISPFGNVIDDPTIGPAGVGDREGWSSPRDPGIPSRGNSIARAGERG
jgi:hypothetical protein